MQLQEVLQFKELVLDQLKKEKDVIASELGAEMARGGGGATLVGDQQANGGQPRGQHVEAAIVKAEGANFTSQAPSSHVRGQVGHDNIAQQAGSAPIPAAGAGAANAMGCTVTADSDSASAVAAALANKKPPLMNNSNNKVRSPGVAGTAPEAHAVTRRSAGRLESATSGEIHSHAMEPDPMMHLEKERESSMSKIAMRESRLVLGTQATAPLLQRPKTHWDYVLDEVQWLALDYRQELRWKMGLAQATARVCQEKALKRDLKPVPAAKTGGSSSGSSSDRMAVDGKNEQQQGGNEETETEKKARAATVAQAVALHWERFGGARVGHLLTTAKSSVNEQSRVIKEESMDVDKTGAVAPASSTFFEAPTLMGVSNDSNVFTTRKQLQKAVAAAAINSVTPVSSNVVSPPPALVGIAAGLTSPQIEASANANYNFEFLNDVVTAFVSKGAAKSGENKQPVSVTAPLLPHQQKLVSHILAMSRTSGQHIPCAPLVHGEEFVGKTTAVLAATTAWLDNPTGDSSSTSAATGRSVRPFVSILAPARGLLRWISELKRTCPDRHMVVWNPGCDLVTKEDHDDKSPYYLLCAIEQLGDLLYDPTGPFYLSGVDKAPENELAASSIAVPRSLVHIQGVVVDDRDIDFEAFHASLEDWRLRHIRELSVREVLTPQQANMLAVEAVTKARSKGGVIHPLGVLADHVNAAVTSRRCVVSQDMPSRAHVGCYLSFLIPPSSLLPLSTNQAMGTLRAVTNACASQHWLKWCEQCQVGNSKGTHSMLKSYPSACLATVSLLAGLTTLDERLIDNQTREEILPLELNSGPQRQKYRDFCKYLINTGAFSGQANNYSTSQLAYGTTALRDICFNHSFVSLLWHTVTPRPVSTSATTSDIEAAKDDDEKAAAGSITDEQEVADAAPARECVGTAIGPHFSPSLHTVATTAPVATKTAAKGKGSKASKVGTVSSDEKDGSGKFDSLHEVLDRFLQLRVVLVVENETQQAAVHSLLKRHGTKHISPGCTSLEGDMIWLSVQAELFDERDDSSAGVIVVTSHMMSMPGLLPREVDVVIVMSESWDEVRTARDICQRFKLRLLSAGHTGDPVTVVRIVAKNTVEETLVRKKQSLIRCQGMPIRDLLGSAAFTSKDDHADVAAFQMAPVGVRNPPPAAYSDLRERVEACHAASYDDASSVQSQINTAVTQALYDYIYGGAALATGLDAQSLHWKESHNHHLIRANRTRYIVDGTAPLKGGSPYAPLFASTILSRLHSAQRATDCASPSVHKKNGKQTASSGDKAKRPMHSQLALQLHMARTLCEELARTKSDFLEDLSMGIVTVEQFEDPCTITNRGPTDLSDTDMRRIQSIGLSAGEKQCHRLFNAHGCHPDSITITPQYGISSACSLAFRDTLNEHRRLGQEMDVHLYVNPIQNACRADTVDVASWQMASYDADASVTISYREKQNEMQQSLRMRTPRTGEGSAAKRKLLEQGPIVGLVYKRARLEVERDGATAPIPGAGAQAAYSVKPHLMVASLQRSKAEMESSKATVWRPAEDDTIMVVQTIFKDPRFLLTAYAVNKLPENISGVSYISGRSVRRIRERFEHLSFSGKYAESIGGRLAPKINAMREAAQGPSTAEGGSAAPEYEALQRIWTALDHLGVQQEAEKATSAVMAKDRAAAILDAVSFSGQAPAPAAPQQVRQQQTRSAAPQPAAAGVVAPQPGGYSINAQYQQQMQAASLQPPQQQVQAQPQAAQAMAQSPIQPHQLSSSSAPAAASNQGTSPPPPSSPPVAEPVSKPTPVAVLDPFQVLAALSN
jgi:hypothetical protein